MTHTPSELRALLDRHGLAARRALGQNFVADPNTVRRIARLAGIGPDDHVVEIGAGVGSLTLALAETGAAVTAVEIDRDLLPALREAVEHTGPGSVTVVEGDALELDWADLLRGAEPWHLVANLPYNVATPLVLDLLRAVPAIDPMLVMVQREAGERIAARPGEPAVGIPSLIAAYFGEATVVGRVPASVFMPRPKVESVLVRIVRRPPPVDVPLDAIEPLIRAGYGQRRKTLRRSLSGLVDDAAFAAAGIDAGLRAEKLDLADWARLARSVA